MSSAAPAFFHKPSQEFTYVRTYSRWVENLKRRESYNETVDRYLAFMVEQLGDTITPHFLKLARNSILSMDTMPSMRAMWAAGDAAKADNCTMYNCFEGSEKFLTYEGLKTFNETVGTTQQVLNIERKWVPATIQSFGEQPIQRVIFKGPKKSNIRVPVLVTPDHKWITTNRGETTCIQKGDTISFAGWREKSFNLEAWIRGFGFGDGTVETTGRAKVRLCGVKDSQWLPMFKQFGHNSICYPPSYEGDAVVRFHKGYFEDWKHLPEGEDANYLSSWLSGYLAADGHQGNQPGISSQSIEAIEFVKQIAPLAGYMVTGESKNSQLETNLGVRKSTLKRLTLRSVGQFRVESIEVVGTAKVFCAVEPKTRTFTLASGILTGNCSYMVMDNIRSFSELLYILMCGTGVGFSVERQYTDLLPKFAKYATGNIVDVVVQDNRKGWADAYKEVLEACWRGDNVRPDVSAVRKRGARLITMGGRASGPEPLLDLFAFVAALFTAKRRKGQYKLNPIDVLDINNKAAEIVVVGGVRRSSEISFSDLDDREIAIAKIGQFWYAGLGHRSMSNNSIAFNVKPDVITYTEEFLNLMKSGTGERGFFNRAGALKQMTANGRRKPHEDVGGNPCMEILLRPEEFCNLSEVVVRPTDKLEDLIRKTKAAAMFGAWQSTFTHFPYLNETWAKNCKEERLLGVSLTGIMDHPVLNNVNDKMKKWLGEMKAAAISETERWCRRLGISMSAAITCVKPSGTVSQLVDSSSGIHARYSAHYIRRFRISATDPLFRMLRDQGVPFNAEVGQTIDTAATMVLDFPFASPVGAVTRHDITAIQQLEHWKVYKYFWCEHNPSVTVYVGEDEWLETLSWCYRNFDDLCGVSFLPKSEHVYQLAPYEEVDKVKYDDLLSKFPKIDYSKLTTYEQEDNTEGSKSYACVGDRCEI